MKPWQINIILIIGAILVAIFLPAKIAKSLLEMVFFGTAIWAYNDSKKIGIEKYKKTAFMPSTKPFGVFFIVVFFWIIAFPVYISWRYKVINGKIPLKQQK